MSNATLRDQAVAELKQTTVTGRAWVRQGRKPGHFKKAMGYLAQITDTPPTGGGTHGN